LVLRGGGDLDFVVAQLGEQLGAARELLPERCRLRHRLLGLALHRRALLAHGVFSSLAAFAAPARRALRAGRSRPARSSARTSRRNSVSALCTSSSSARVG